MHPDTAPASPEPTPLERFGEVTEREKETGKIKLRDFKKVGSRDGRISILTKLSQ